jgi:hypothetical protein
MVYSRALDASRFEGVTYPVVNAYFDVLTDLFLENSHPSDAIFNVDETGFALCTKEIPQLVEEAEAEASKEKSKKRRTTRAITPKIEDEEEEGIEEIIYESESDCTIVASSGLRQT